MKNVKYTLMPDVAGRFLEKEADLSVFARDCRMIFVHKNIPPHALLNQALGLGYSPREAEWEPFSVSEAEYAELINDLLKTPSERYRQTEPPKSIMTFEQWVEWLEQCGY